jgi:autotransporter-associated beta strand protein
MKCRSVLAVSIASILIAHSASAATFTWDASGSAPLDDGSGFWNATGSTNWFDGTSTYGAWSNSLNDEAIFGVGNGAAGTITVGTVNANKLTFNAPGSGSYTLSGGTITLGGTTPTITTATGVTATIGSVIAGTAGLTTAGSGKLVLTGNNIYSGTTNINAGTLQLGDGTAGNDGTLGGGAVVVGGAGTLDFDIAGTQTVSYGITGAAGATLVKDGAGTLTLNNTGAVNFGNNGSSLQVKSGRLIYANIGTGTGLYQKSIDISSGATLEMNVAASTTNAFGAWDGTFTGTGTLLKSGAGTLDLGYYGGTRSVNFGAGALIWVSGGTLSAYHSGNSTVSWASNKAAMQVDSGATLDLAGGTVLVDALNGAGAISGGGSLTVGVNNAGGSFSGTMSGSGSFTKTGAGTQILSGSSTFTGNTLVNAGVLNLSNTNALAGSTFAGGAGSLVFDASVASHAFTFGGLSGSTDLALQDNAATPNAIALTVGGNNASSSYSGNLSGGGTASLSKAGTGTLALSGVSSYGGTTAVSGGMLQFAKPASFYSSTTGGVTGSNVAKLTVSSGATAAFNVGGATDFTGADISTLLSSSTGGVGFASGSSLGLDTTNGAFIYSSSITDTANGSIGLTKLGGVAANTLSLSGANTYTGVTLISAGSIVANTAANVSAIPGDITLVNGGTSNTNLWFTANNQLGGNGVLIFSGTAGNHGRFMLEGTSQSVAGINNNGTPSGVVQNSEPGAAGPTNSGTGTLTLTGSGTYSFGGFMRNATGTLVLAKTGTGTQTLIGNQINYTGATSISAGRMILQDTSAFASATAISGGVLELNASASWTMAPNLSGAGNVEKTGVGAVVLSGTNTNTGATTVTAGNLQFSAPRSFYNSTGGALNSANVGKLTVKSGGTATFNFGGGSDFNATDLGTLLATSTGGVGFLASSSLGLDTTNGVFNYSPSITDTANGSLGLSKLGANLLTLSGNNSYTGGTNVNAGVLAFTNGALGTTGNIAMNGGTLQWASSNTQDISSRFAMTAGNTAIIDTNGNNVTFGSAIGASTTGALTKVGAGTLTFTRTNTYTGMTTVGGGTLALDFSVSGAPATNIVATASPLSMGGGTLLLTGKASTVNSQQFAGLTVASGGSTIQLSANATSNPLLLNLGAVTKATGGTISFVLPTGTQGTTNGFKTSTTNTNNILGPWAFVGTSYATVSSGNIVGYTGATAAATEVNLTDTTGAVNYDLAAAGGTAPTTVSANTIRYTGSVAGTTAPGATSFTVNGLMNAGSALWTIGTGNLTIGSTKELVVNTASADIAITGVVVNNGSNASALTKTGSGTLTLSATNSYTGTTTVNAGTLVFAPTVNSASNITLVPGSATINQGSTLKLDFTNVKNNAAYPAVLLNGSSGSTTVNTGGTLELYADSTHAMNNTAVLFNTGGASLSGAGTLKKTGAGAVDFWNAGPGSGFTGMIDVEDGVLTFQQGSGAFSGKSALTIAATSATVDVRGGGNLVVDALTGTGAVSSSAGANTFTIGNNGGSGTFDGIIADGANTTVRNGMTTGWNGTLALVKNGTGAQTLSATNAYSGTTTVNAGSLIVTGSINGSGALVLNGGKLQLGASNVLKDAAPLTLGGGTLAMAGFSDTVGALTLSLSSTIDLGNGSSTLKFGVSNTAWTASQILTITNWDGSTNGGGTDQIFFGNSASGLLAANVAEIQFLNPAGFAPGTYGAQMLSTGELVAVVPEPGAWVSLLSGCGVLLGLRRRRR